MAGPDPTLIDAPLDAEETRFDEDASADDESPFKNYVPFKEESEEGGGSVPKRLEVHRKLLRDFERGLAKVRRVLANFPTYKIFDDHDVTDDWNLNPLWYDRVMTTLDALAELRRALADSSSWSAEMPGGVRQTVVLRERPPSSAAALPALHPLGRLSVKQALLPLNTARDIDTSGGAPVRGERRFRVSAVTLNGDPQSTSALPDLFAPAQFFDLTDKEKLASPSFEIMDGGVAFGSEAIEFAAGESVDAPLVYEAIVIRPGRPAGAAEIGLHAAARKPGAAGVPGGGRRSTGAHERRRALPPRRRDARDGAEGAHLYARLAVSDGELGKLAPAWSLAPAPAAVRPFVRCTRPLGATPAGAAAYGRGPGADPP